MKPKSPNSFSPDARFMLGVSQLGLDLAGELSETIGAVHHQVNLSTPLRLFAHRQGLSRRIYGLVRKGLMMPAQALGFAGRHVPHSDHTLMTLNVQAAINGVFGDLLERHHNPLTLEMSLHGDVPAAGKPLLLFVHGLCLHEKSWDSAAHQAFADSMRQQGFAVARLRYNSGRPIADNAQQLSALLERSGASSIVLVGHSMGGLISRSALHQATLNGYQWPQRVTHLAALGSPHHGATAERLGNYANRLLTLTRWTTPLTHLGNLRSAAIHDLRFGSLLHADRDRAGHRLHTHDPREPIEVPGSVAHCFMAATRSEQSTGSALRSDMLVTPASALAEDYPGSDNVTRELFYGMNHMQLMWDERVYIKLGAWLGRR